MSRSQPALTNPAQHFLEWSGSRGKLEYWDKEKKIRVPVKLPFTFMVLDELSTITGYSDADESGFWSNEVRSIMKDELNVRTKKGTRYVGTYKQNGIVQMPLGAKYAKSIYIAHAKGEDYILGNLKLSGAALTSWIEFSSSTPANIQNGTVTLTGSTEGKKGATVYQIPTFEYRSSTSVEDKVATELDRELQIYLSQYLAPKAEDHNVWSDDPIDPELGKATPEQEAEYEALKKSRLQAQPDPIDTYRELAGEQFEGDPSTIPFTD